MFQLNSQIEEFRRECELLKEANRKLVTAAFNADRESEVRETERAFKLQISQLQSAIKDDLEEKTKLCNQLTTERGI